jgi:hypoxanthine-DNA glycosylase
MIFEKNVDKAQPIIHSFEPIADKNSRLLILGTMPSPASLAAGMYYAHPRNAFWRIMHDLTGDEPVSTNESKRKFLLNHGIALWDTLCLCKRRGASDSNIKVEMPNSVETLVLRYKNISAVFLNGGAAYRYYNKYHAADITLPWYALPSTSPANASIGYEIKLETWRIIEKFLYSK